MSLPESIVAAQVKQLLGLVEHYKHEQTELLLNKTRAEAKQLIRDAFHNAAEKVSADIRASREKMQQEIRMTHAQLQTLAIQSRHQAEAALLQQAWESLRRELINHWQHDKLRTRWITSVVDKADRLLLQRTWIIEYAAGWVDTERAQIQVGWADRGFVIAQCVENKSLEAGLRVVAGSAVVDGSLQGLMHDRAGFESVFMAHYRNKTARSNEFMNKQSQVKQAASADHKHD